MFFDNFIYCDVIWPMCDLDLRFMEVYSVTFELRTAEIGGGGGTDVACFLMVLYTFIWPLTSAHLPFLRAIIISWRLLGVITLYLVCRLMYGFT